MEAIISFRISHLFNILNSILLNFVPKKLLSLLPISRFFLASTKTLSPPPQPEPEPETMDPAELKRVFQMFDRNGDGRISQKELSESLRNLGISIPEEELSTMIQKIDANKDEFVDLEEFEELYRTIMAEKEGDNGDEDMREAFHVFDRDGDGFITSDELNVVMESLKQGKTIEECKLMIGTVDADGDGRVDFKEFIQMMRGGRFVGSS